MTTEELVALFEKHEDEYYLEGVFHKPETYYGPTKRRDLNAFLLLERLVPGERDMISGAEHDEFFLDVDLEELAKIATEEDVKNLLRCGVVVSEHDCLRMNA